MSARLLVCGGRDYADRATLVRTLDWIAYHWRGIECLIEGGATGADRLAREWAEARGIHVETFLPDWPRDGKRAGPLRNQRMLDEGKPTVGIAFPGGRGTADMVRRAERAKLAMFYVPVESPAGILSQSARGTP